MKRIVVLGGGTGTFVVLSGLKEYPLDLSAIVTMMDSGGSTGKLRDQLGVLPPGDLRQCLVALSDAPLLWRKLFLYRFESGDLKGHNFGNLFLSALEKVSGTYDEVIETASYVLKTKGSVVPVTFNKTHLCVEYEGGTIVKGEGNIDKNHTQKKRIVSAFLEPNVQANPKAAQAIVQSDYLIVGPGDIYTSIVPIFLVSGIREAIKKSRAAIIYVMNLMTKSGQTTGYTASDHLEDIVHYAGRLPEVVVMNTGRIPTHIIKWYQSCHESVVKDDLDGMYLGRVVRDDVLDRQMHAKSETDTMVNPLVRSILRHDSKKLAKVLNLIIT